MPVRGEPCKRCGVEVANASSIGEGQRMPVIDPTTIAVVLNPTAGGGKTLGLLTKINAELQKIGRPYHIHVTKAPGDAQATARRFAEDGVSVILSVGGDGTLNEVINGILESG